MIKQKDRFLYVDLLRAWAMTIMIEVHVVNTFIRPEIRGESWFPLLNFINGLVAPSFIFISGFAFILSTGSNLDEIRSFGRLFRKRLGRIGLIFLVGYLLHIPYYSFRNILIYANPEELKSFYNVDVLQCTGAGLLILFFLRIFIKSDRFFHGVITFLAVAIVSSSPILWNIDFSRYMPLPLACYFNEINGSYFPVFPWLGFLFGGASICMFFLNARAAGSEDIFMRRTMKISAVTGVVCVLILTQLAMKPWFSIKPSPLFFMERFAIVIFFLGLFRLYYRKKGERESLFLDISRESLLIYWLHLQIIYRSLWGGKSLDAIISRSFGVAECAAASALLIILMFAAAVIWSGIKKRNPSLGRKIFFAVLAGGAIRFFIF